LINSALEREEEPVIGRKVFGVSRRSCRGIERVDGDAKACRRLQGDQSLLTLHESRRLQAACKRRRIADCMAPRDAEGPTVRRPVGAFLE
jgi:hypothetical protein